MSNLGVSDTNEPPGLAQKQNLCDFKLDLTDRNPFSDIDISFDTN